MSQCSYLVDKLNAAEFNFDRFKHATIQQLFSENHFREIVTAREVGYPRFTVQRAARYVGRRLLSV